MEGRPNTYHFYVSVADQKPVQFHMLGRDDQFGSHYDEYIINYEVFNNYVTDPSVFDIPTHYPCGDFPGPGTSQLRHTRGALMEVEDVIAAEKESTRHHADFIKRHNKSYANETEAYHRRAIFSGNVRFINSMNSKGLSYKLAVNHLTDMTVSPQCLTAATSDTVMVHAQHAPHATHSPCTTRSARSEPFSVV